MPMKIALAGTGKTGQTIERMALEQGHEIVARFNSANPVLDQATDTLVHCDVVIDFSKPELALPHIALYCKLDLNAVIGTTGWYDHLPDVEDHVADSDCALLYAPNFSIGVAVLSRLVEKAALLFDKLPEYDAAVHEAHHQYKLDSPSGTALHLADILIDHIDRKKNIATETQHQKIPASELHVTSQRLGHIFGRHTITFDSPYDNVILRHDAKNRDGFAFGALRAAEWIIDKEGLFTLDDLLTDWLADDL